MRSSVVQFGDSQWSFRDCKQYRKSIDRGHCVSLPAVSRTMNSREGDSITRLVRVCPQSSDRFEIRNRDLW
ncbi:hypothetical protein LC1Hm_2626 [Halomicrobium sp. LC1Hm]|nr:hypothetical protein LC1Hm_2626 [Halomicrobium sp. LC1Hm]